MSKIPESDHSSWYLLGGLLALFFLSTSRHEAKEGKDKSSNAAKPARDSAALSSAIAKNPISPTKQDEPADDSKKTANDDRYYRVQNWIRWGTWAAVLSASAYAGVTAVQWRDANRNFIINQRAWIGVNGSVRIDSISMDEKGAGKVTFSVPIKNYGNSVALDVGMSAEAINGYDPMDSASNTSCQTAETFSNLRYLKRIKNPAGPEMPQDMSFGLLFQGDGSMHSFPDRIIQTSKTPLGLAIIGCIFYRDQFGKVRRTRLCYGGIGGGVVVAGSLLNPCIIGTNDAE